MKRRHLVLAFVLGAVLSAAAHAYLMHRVTVYVDCAKVIKQGQDSATILFYHDATDRAIKVRVPVRVFPIYDPKTPSFVADSVTVDVWPADNFKTSDLFSESALEVVSEFEAVPTWGRQAQK